MNAAPAARHAPPATEPPWRWQLLRQPLPGLDLQQDQCVDALLVWDLLTGFARHGGPARGSHWRVMLEFTARPATAGLDAWCALPPAEGRQALLRQALAASLARAPTSPVHTAVLPEATLPLLLAGVAAGVLLRFTLGAPCPAPAEPARPDDAGPPPAWPGAAQAGLVSTLGLVDDGCCLAHEHFRDADGRSRVLGLWDQDTSAVPDGPWRRHAGPDGTPACRYGAELARPSIEALLARHPGLGERAERAAYAALGRPHWGAPGRGQGASLMHLLAGPHRRPDAAPDTGTDHDDEADRPTDAARLPVLFVQLPADTAADRGGGALGFHTVDGARWIVERSRALASDPNGWRCTIALGPGGFAGPHDGSSMAEQALDQLAADARVALVVAAGDGGDARIHAQARVRQDEPAVWWLRLPPDKPADTFVQIWLPADEPPERFQLVVQAPGLPASPLLQLGQAAVLSRGDGLPVAGVVRAMRVAQGLRGHLVLLALAPSAPRRDQPPRPLAPAGLWRIELQAAGPQAAEVHAWVERDDQGHRAPGLPGGPRPQRARFEPGGRALGAGRASGLSAGLADGLSTSHTLGSLANGLRCTVAAGHVLRGGRVSAGSAQGPRRGTGREAAPLCYAPVDASAERPGVPVPGFFSGQRSRTGGTAAAAAQVARGLAEGRLTEPASRWLRPPRPPLHAANPPPSVPAEARCLPPQHRTDPG